MKNISLRDYIAQSGLFLEGVESLAQNSPINPYSGINVTKTDNEPIDQIQGFLIAKRIQEWNQRQSGNPGTFTIFIAGLYEVFNAQTLNQLKQTATINVLKEKRKQKIFKKLIISYNLKAEIKLTQDLWQNQGYWQILKNLIDTQIFTRGLLINDTLNFYQTKDQLMNTIRMKKIPRKYVNLPLTFIKKIGNWPAPLLYTPAQVSEALFLKQTENVNTKIGQAQERVYDKYITDKLNLIRLRQPTDFLSTQTKPQVITPYIDKSKNKPSVRIFFTDTAATIKDKLAPIIPQEYVFTFDSQSGEILNPFVEKAVFAIESARCQAKTPVTINNQPFDSGKDLINALLQNRLTVAKLKPALPQLISQYILL